MLAKVGGMRSEVGLFVPYTLALYPFRLYALVSDDACVICVLAVRV